MFKNIKKSWEEVTISEYDKLMKIKDENEIEVLYQQIELLSDYTIDELEVMSFLEVKKIAEQLKFLKEEIKLIKIPDHLNLNGKDFILNKEISKLTTTEFLDFNHYLNNEGLNYIIATFISPAKKEKTWYGDKFVKVNEKDYIKEDHFNFIYNNLSIVVANSIWIFFSKVMKRSLNHIITSLDLEIHKMIWKERKILIMNKILKKKVINGDGLNVLIKSRKQLIEVGKKYII